MLEGLRDIKNIHIRREAKMHRKGLGVLVAVCCCQSGNADAQCSLCLCQFPSAEALLCKLAVLIWWAVMKGMFQP